MIPCDEARSLLPALLDGELTEAIAGRIRGHVDDCVACAAILKEYRTLRAAVSAKLPAAGEDLWGAVREQIAVTDPLDALLEEVRLMHIELKRLRGEVADLRHELSRRPPSVPRRSNALDFPDVPRQSQNHYRLV